MDVIRLTCEQAIAPLGVDIRNPRLSWVLGSSTINAIQTAYQVVVESEGQIIWDSGKVDSDRQLDVRYDGNPLCSGQECSWRVRVWDRDGVSSQWSQSARFSMGLLDVSDWTGGWIGAQAENYQDQEERPAVMLRREVGLGKQVKRAQAFVAGLGYYELFVNGQRVDDHVLDPGFTDYDKRVLYVSYDITPLVASGRNAIGVLLGSGWYDMPIPDAWGYEKAPWRCPPKALVQIEIEFEDGSRQSIASDENWRVSTDGPIRYNTLRGGETYDARLECLMWDRPEFDDSGWSPALIVPKPKGRLVSQMLPPIKVVRTIEPARITEPKPGVFVVDLGQNITGWAEITVQGGPGDRIQLVYGERLSEDGTLDQRDISCLTFGRFARDEYILKGGGEEIWHPRFAYYGFQYVEVTGMARPPKLVGKVVHTAAGDCGSFSCSNDDLNAIQETLRRTILNTSHSIPEDCPHREKNGWMCDGLIAAEAAMLNFDMSRFYSKWIDDMEDAQGETGRMPSIVPTPGWGDDTLPGDDYACPGWGSACVILPWLHYLQYGGVDELASRFQMMKRYTDYLGTRATGHIVSYGLGDWLEVGAVRPTRTPVELTSTAYYYYDAMTVSRVARILGNETDAETYAMLADEIKKAFNKEFFDPKTCGYGEDEQTANALPIMLGMVPDGRMESVVEALKRSVEVRGGHISAGILGTTYVLDALSTSGLADVAYSMIAKKDFPGWLNMLEHGATTLWEAWEGNGSLDHPAFGCVGAWFIHELAGIRPDPTSPGFKKIIIRPQPVGDLKWVKASYESRYGLIRSEWTRGGGRFELKVSIPANTSATVCLSLEEHEVGSGEHAFVVEG